MKKSVRESRELMAFTGHLEVLRKKIFQCLLVFLLALVATVILLPFITGAFLSPLEGTGIRLYSYTPYEKLVAYVKMCFAGALALSLPFIAAITAGFVFPGLLPGERPVFTVLGTCSLAFFFAGAFVSVRFLTERLLVFLYAFGEGDGIPQLWSFGEYCNLVLNIALAGGFILQAPFVLIALIRMRILRTDVLKTFRRHAVLGTAVLAAVLSPGPDVLLQLVFGLILYLSFETALLVGRVFERRP